MTNNGLNAFYPNENTNMLISHKNLSQIPWHIEVEDHGAKFGISRRLKDTEIIVCLPIINDHKSKRIESNFDTSCVDALSRFS